MGQITLEELPLALTIDYVYHPGSSNHVTRGLELEKGDDAEIEIKHVWVGHSNGRIDIYNALSVAEVNAIIKEIEPYLGES